MSPTSSSITAISTPSSLSLPSALALATLSSASLALLGASLPTATSLSTFSLTTQSSPLLPARTTSTSVSVRGNPQTTKPPGRPYKSSTIILIRASGSSRGESRTAVANVSRSFSSALAIIVVRYASPNSTTSSCASPGFPLPFLPAIQLATRGAPHPTAPTTHIRRGTSRGRLPRNSSGAAKASFCSDSPAHHHVQPLHFTPKRFLPLTTCPKFNLTGHHTPAGPMTTARESSPPSSSPASSASSPSPM
ncbi:hypothetical protein M427DRAFT_402304 [Gonapodya prolifera JEL478]|uniref:Uncharacterized protein n=1 Tax=Gonapodya prolifera (strain JEL478) TaxID=1344416 RepID=A0A139ATS6_GONPJ|nr:hypothetical protein M427DRAFT_402304 [Gonapodya prolifera JEL478]|eukprot:KXS20104.1 hypothetical protein M427DRAFT_402304 [Gonapodya prolifera JEL478]